jgi:type IV secretory pathway ATPase VirB11/archaellum biosynthesis ATPase
MVDARLPDGSRVNAIIPPLAIDGPTLTIRKFAADPYQADDLVEFGTMSSATSKFLESCVRGRINIMVAGGTGAGKTTTLNVISSFIPDDERIVTIEDAAELQLRQDHVVRLEARPPNTAGTGAFTVRELVINCLRMRPERIIVGECRGKEALDMLQAMNTGHDGSLTTGHANSPRDMLSRLETMVLMAGMDLPVKAIREQVSSAIDLIVQQARLRDGSRRITNITEVQGMEGDTIVLQDIFAFRQQSFKGGKLRGELLPSGIRPMFMPKLEDAGIRLPSSVFGVSDWYGTLGGTLSLPPPPIPAAEPIRRPEGRTLVRCPQCGHEQSNAEPSCVACGVPLTRPLPAVTYTVADRGDRPEIGTAQADLSGTYAETYAPSAEFPFSADSSELVAQVEEARRPLMERIAREQKRNSSLSRSAKPATTPVLIRVGAIAMLVAVAVLGVMVARSAMTPTGSTMPAVVTDEQARQAVMKYAACPGAPTLASIADRTMNRSGPPQVQRTRVLGNNGDLTRVAFVRNAADGSEQETTFSYQPSTGLVGAESHEAVAILRSMEAMCAAR